LQICHSRRNSGRGLTAPTTFPDARIVRTRAGRRGGGPFRTWYTPERCHEDFVVAARAPDHPPLRAIWCAQAYREFDGLYDVALIAVTENHGDEALVSRLSLQAVGYDAAMALGQRFLAAVQR
jgi:hypothetical protein